MEAIVLSGPPASGKTTVSNILSRKLGMPVIGGSDILKEMAADRGYKMSGEDWWDTPNAMKFVKERETNPDFDKETDRRLLKKIEEGNVIVTSYVAPWLSKYGFKVWLDGSPANRAKRMAERDHKTADACAGVIKEREAKNTKIYKGIYNIEFGKDMSVFDLIIDTNKMGAEQVTEEILDKYDQKHAKKG